MLDGKTELGRSGLPRLTDTIDTNTNRSAIGVPERRVMENLSVSERRCDVFGDHGADECDGVLSKVKTVSTQGFSPHH